MQRKGILKAECVYNLGQIHFYNVFDRYLKKIDEIHVHVFLSRVNGISSVSDLACFLPVFAENSVKMDKICRI